MKRAFSALWCVFYAYMSVRHVDKSFGARFFHQYGACMEIAEDDLHNKITSRENTELVCNFSLYISVLNILYLWHAVRLLSMGFTQVYYTTVNCMKTKMNLYNKPTLEYTLIYPEFPIWV